MWIAVQHIVASKLTTFFVSCRHITPSNAMLLLSSLIRMLHKDAIDYIKAITAAKPTLRSKSAFIKVEFPPLLRDHPHVLLYHAIIEHSCLGCISLPGISEKIPKTDIELFN